MRLFKHDFPAAILALIAGTTLVAVGAASTSWAGTLDQQQTDSDGNRLVHRDSTRAQTFTAGISGSLDQADLLISRHNNATSDFTVEIRTTSAGKPTATVLATGTIPKSSVPLNTAEFVPVTFSPAVPVTAGTMYALVARAGTTSLNGFYYWRVRETNPYPDGQAFFGGSPTWNADGWPVDHTFKTYVVQPQTITFDPSSTGSVGGNQALSASSDSGLTVSLAVDPSSDTGVCSLSGLTLTYLDAGTCKVTASQPGDGNYAAATPVTASIFVSAAKPSAPTSVTAVRGNQQASVSWEASAANGSAVTGYTVTSSPEAKTCSGDGDDTSCTVTGLTNGTAYTFTVTATNQVGTSDASDPSDATTPAAVPSAPTSVSAVRGNQQASVSWEASAANGSAVTGYTVTSSPEAKTCTGDGDDTSCTVTGLTNGTAYTFTVTATNDVGTSNGSSPSSAVTPAAKPSAPTSVAAVRGNQQASVSWEASAANGSAVTGYTVTSSPDAKTCVSTDTECTVTGLTNGTSYTFTVTATNDVGTSETSPPSQAVTPLAPLTQTQTRASWHVKPTRTKAGAVIVKVYPSSPKATGNVKLTMWKRTAPGRVFTGGTKTLYNGQTWFSVPKGLRGAWVFRVTYQGSSTHSASTWAFAHNYR